MLFSRKKKEEPLNISSEQLCVLLNKALYQAAYEIEGNCYSTGPEIMFDYDDGVHFAGIRYRKDTAELCVYLDDAEYPTVEDLYNLGVLNGQVFSTIGEGIIVEPHYKELLENI